jgi:D-alanyl-D-alanine carboxypeptidase (penicillin-binding protein 5/6)
MALLVAGCAGPAPSALQHVSAPPQPTVAAAVSPALPPPLRVHPDLPVPGRHIGAESYVLMDAVSGRVLAEWRADRRIEPASLTKLVTFDLALSAVADGEATMASPVPIGPDVRRLDHRSGITLMGLDAAGPTVPLRELLLGAILPSGNDAALAIADFLGGSPRGFAAQMNDLANRIGMQRTYFVNPNGLTAAGQLTTAHDMAILARHIWLVHPGFAAFTAARSFRWQGTVLYNDNPLIRSDPRVFGMKGGWLPTSGYNLVIIARQGGRTLIAVAMGSQGFGENARAVETLLNWGFAHDAAPPRTGSLPAAAGRKPLVRVTAAGGKPLVRVTGIQTTGGRGSA